MSVICYNYLCIYLFDSILLDLVSNLGNLYYIVLFLFLGNFLIIIFHLFCFTYNKINKLIYYN